MRKRTSEGGRRTGNPAPRSRFSTVGAATLLTYPTRLCRCLKGRAKDLRHIAPPPTRTAFFIGPESSRLVTSHECDPRIKEWGGVSRREGGDKMAASVWQGCLRWLPGVAWRNRYSCLGSLPRGEGRPEPNRGLERGVVSLSRARPEECSSGDGATHLHLELGRRCDCLRLGRSESGLNLSLCPFHSTRDKKNKNINKKHPLNQVKWAACPPLEPRQGWTLLSLGVVLLGGAPRCGKSTGAGVGRLSLWILGL